MTKIIAKVILGCMVSTKNCLNRGSALKYQHQHHHILLILPPMFGNDCVFPSLVMMAWVILFLRPMPIFRQIPALQSTTLSSLDSFRILYKTT